ncbi:sigma-54-dependent Fis family transcriptional regulator [Fictibacillus sp. Mic-4]|uniref:sigma-54 interaction domain-containing protein n=1 Tax=Fictibacillus TaxID=1329200 RepID=UPI000421167E|nr:sigma-54-dependent Fis family transcriptional regulator [Fictibacillus gelatini]
MSNQEELDALRKLNLIYEKIIEEIDAGVHVIDAYGKTIIYNKKMTEIEDMEREDVLGKNVLDVFMFQENQYSTLVKALQTGESKRNEKQSYFNNKGQEITTVNNTFPIITNGQVIGAMEIAKDITKLARLIHDKALHKDGTRFTFDNIIGKSETFSEVIERARRATRTFSSVLIIGETGTGKELFAQSIHNGSDRALKPFISQNCAALPETLIESLLFGTKKGAFTGSTDRPGLFEQAEGGTLLLDEINSLSPYLQAKLLRALQEKTIRRVGDTVDRAIDVRIIATMNEDPVDAIANDRLRKDLYYRLSVVSLFIPPLRERKEDIPVLIQHFIDKYNHLFQMDVKGLDSEVYDAFLEYNWPGNVRELQHIIEGAMNLVVNEEYIQYAHLPVHLRHRWLHKGEAPLHSSLSDIVHEDEEQSIKQLKEKMEEVEKYYIQQALKVHHYNISRTAKALGISRQSLQYRLRKFQISETKQ